MIINKDKHLHARKYLLRRNIIYDKDSNAYMKDDAADKNDAFT